MDLEATSPAEIYRARAESMRMTLGSMDRNTLESVLEDVAHLATDGQDSQAALQQIHAIVVEAVREAGRRR